MGILTWKLCVCLGLLCAALAEKAPHSVVEAREDAATLSTFTLFYEGTSHLFSSCFEKANSVNGSLHSIEVDEDVWYTRYLIDSDVDVTWEDVEGEYSIIECANKAFEAESQMFMFADNVCTLATEGIYNPRGASCDGEEVFILDPLDVCFTSLGSNDAGHKYYDWMCRTECKDGGILQDEDCNELDPDSLPDEILACCPTAPSPCLYFDGAEALPCEADRYCHFLGMMLPEALTDPMINELKNVFTTGSSQGGTSTAILVNVQFQNSQYVHLPSEAAVESSEWASSAPTDFQLIGLDSSGKLVQIAKTDTVYVVCQEISDLPKCSAAK